VKKPQRIMALAFVMVLCVLIYRLAEVRVRQRLVASEETVPNQLRRPTGLPCAGSSSALKVSICTT
jgi:transposase